MKGHRGAIAQHASAAHRKTGRLSAAAFTLLLAMLACNAPLRENATLPPATSALPDGTPASAATAGAPDIYTLVPSATPEALDPLTILDTYPSLAGVRQRLAEMTFILEAGGSTATGRQLLELMLVDWRYDPGQDNPAKEALFSRLYGYEWPHPGAGAYLINVATGLFAEAHRLYPWSLRDYSPQQIDNLFVEDGSLHTYLPETDPALHRGDLPLNLPNALHHWYPSPDQLVEDAHFRQFNLARRIAQGAATPADAAAAVVVWMQQNFFHAYAPGYAWEVYLDGQTPRNDGGPVAYPLSIERIYEERVSGCHEPTILMEGMFHSLNIPAVRLMMHGHGVLYLPVLDRYIHGDHVVAYHDAPPGMLLLTSEEIRPFAEDQAFLYDIIYPDKYVTPFGSVPLLRDGSDLYIYNANARDFATGACIQIGGDDWARISQQLSAYNLRYDAQNCVLSSDRVPILALDELSALAP